MHTECHIPGILTMTRRPSLWPRLRWLIGVSVLANCVCTESWVGNAFAKGDYADLKPIPVVVMLGDKQNHLKFFPDRLTFETGKLYKLLLVNDSPVRHELASDDLANAVFTLKAEIVSAEGEEIAEIGGTIREIEIGPGTTAEWYFVPLRTVKQAPFICDQPGHLEAGMKGLFTIE